MKDAFGRDVQPGDIVVYATRSGSHQYVNVARVKEIVTKKSRRDNVDREFIRAETFAATDYAFLHGHSKWDRHLVTRTMVPPVASRNVSLKVSGNMVIVNGIDVGRLVEGVKTQQATNFAHAEAHRLSKNNVP